jgi:hypothetical protein
MPGIDAIPNKSSWLSYESCQHSGEHGSSFPLWRVEIDGQLFSKTVSPFCASDERIEKFGCTSCGITGDGMGFFAVRRLGDRVFWIYEEILDSQTERAFENLPDIFVFDRHQYESVLDAGDVDELPELTSNEIRLLIIRYLPPSSLALYSNFANLDDPHGSELLAHIRSQLAEGNFTQTPLSPKRFIEIRIGLDLPGVPECSWFVGENENGFCVMFSAFPKLPCWLSGDAINAGFENSFVRELLLARHPCEG